MFLHFSLGTVPCGASSPRLSCLVASSSIPSQISLPESATVSQSFFSLSPGFLASGCRQPMVLPKMVFCDTKHPLAASVKLKLNRIKVLWQTLNEEMNLSQREKVWKQSYEENYPFNKLSPSQSWHWRPGQPSVEKAVVCTVS